MNKLTENLNPKSSSEFHPCFGKICFAVCLDNYSGVWVDSSGSNDTHATGRGGMLQAERGRTDVFLGKLLGRVVR